MSDSLSIAVLVSSTEKDIDKRMLETFTFKFKFNIVLNVRILFRLFSGIKFILYLNNQPLIQ